MVRSSRGEALRLQTKLRLQEAREKESALAFTHPCDPSHPWLERDVFLPRMTRDARMALEARSRRGEAPSVVEIPW
jgi:hypothetical protein